MGLRPRGLRWTRASFERFLYWLCRGSIRRGAAWDVSPCSVDFDLCRRSGFGQRREISLLRRWVQPQPQKRCARAVTPPGECGQRTVQRLGVNMHANLLLPRGPSAHGIEVRRSICVRRSNERRIGLASFTVGLRPNALDVWSYTASMVRGSSRSHTCCWEVRDVECPHGLNLVSLLAWNQERSKPTGGTSPKRRPAIPSSRGGKKESSGPVSA
jgi:hypothetical protein